VGALCRLRHENKMGGGVPDINPLFFEIVVRG